MKYITIEKVRDLPKTAIYEVRNKKEGYSLGEIEWNRYWRRYWFIPEDNAGYDAECLDEISGFIKGLMEDRRKP